MAYIALYRKWRPKTFTDVVGQKQVSETLMRAIRENKVAHAYLFSGPRGTGKTSMAKIFARAINCVHGPTDHPCNECPTCLQILQGDSMDVIEIDAASNRGIDEMRALRENVNFLPVGGRKKIFIIDEAHMLTTEAWNALLKTIEEPPDHVMFIFATTEAEKLPVTILSRCQRYAFRRITASDISEHLLHVAKESQINLSAEAAQLIAIQADGGLRDALSILDQCSGMTEGGITATDVEDLMGLVSRATVTDFFEALHCGDGAKVLQEVKESLFRGREVLQIPDALAEHIRALLLCKVMPTAEELGVYENIKDRLQEQAKNITVAELENYIRALRQMQADAKQVDSPRIIIEMGLLSICARRSESHDSLESRLASLEAKQGIEDDGIRNRLAALENGQSAGPSNSGYIAAPPVMQTESMPVTVAPPVNSVLEPEKKRRVPRAPSTGRKTKAPIPAAPVPMGSNAGDVTGIVISAGIKPAGTYRDIHGKILQWLDRNAMNMCSSFYKSAQLIYIDSERAVVTFNQNFNIIMATKKHLYEEAVKAFSAVLETPIQLQVVLYNSEEDKAYRAAANGSSSEVRGAVAPVAKEIEEDIPYSPPIEDIDEVLVPVEIDVHEEIPSTHSLPEADAVPDNARRWTPEDMTEEEREDPLLSTALEKLSLTHDIYVETVDDTKEE